VNFPSLPCGWVGLTEWALSNGLWVKMTDANLRSPVYFLTLPLLSSSRQRQRSQWKTLRHRGGIRFKDLGTLNVWSRDHTCNPHRMWHVRKINIIGKGHWRCKLVYYTGSKPTMTNTCSSISRL
jgi:hypothetical protein